MLKLKRIKFRNLFAIAFLIFVVSITVDVVLQINEFFLPDFIKFTGHSYGYKFRSLTINSFMDIKAGDDYSEIVKKVGEPNGIFGSGITRVYYRLSDGNYIIMWFGSSDSGFSDLWEMYIVDNNERGFILSSSLD